VGAAVKGTGEGLGGLAAGLGKGTSYLVNGLGKAGKNLIGAVTDKIGKPLLKNGERLIREGASKGTQTVGSGAKKAKAWNDERRAEKAEEEKKEEEREARRAEWKQESEARRGEWKAKKQEMGQETEQHGHIEQEQIIEGKRGNATRYPIDQQGGPLLIGMLARAGVRFSISDEAEQTYIVINDNDDEQFRETLTANEIELDKAAGERCQYDENDEIDNDAVIASRNGKRPKD
jgi:hypothetical protein